MKTLSVQSTVYPTGHVDIHPFGMQKKERSAPNTIRFNRWMNFIHGVKPANNTQFRREQEKTLQGFKKILDGK